MGCSHAGPSGLATHVTFEDRSCQRGSAMGAALQTFQAVPSKISGGDAPAPQWPRREGRAPGVGRLHADP